jgi:hypothetical protein
MLLSPRFHECLYTYDVCSVFKSKALFTDGNTCSLLKGPSQYSRASSPCESIYPSDQCRCSQPHKSGSTAISRQR